MVCLCYDPLYLYKRDTCIFGSTVLYLHSQIGLDLDENTMEFCSSGEKCYLLSEQHDCT